MAQDGDPLDALVLVWEPTFPGCIIEASQLDCSECEMRKARMKNPVCAIGGPALELHRAPFRRPTAFTEGNQHFFLVSFSRLTTYPFMFIVSIHFNT
jgi:inorganic pyrophosphatase